MFLRQLWLGFRGFRLNKNERRNGNFPGTFRNSPYDSYRLAIWTKESKNVFES